MLRWLLNLNCELCGGKGQVADISRRMLAMAEHLMMQQPGVAKASTAPKKRPACSKKSAGDKKPPSKASAKKAITTPMKKPA